MAQLDSAPSSALLWQAADGGKGSSFYVSLVYSEHELLQLTYHRRSLLIFLCQQFILIKKLFIVICC